MVIVSYNYSQEVTRKKINNKQSSLTKKDTVFFSVPFEPSQLNRDGLDDSSQFISISASSQLNSDENQRNCAKCSNAESRIMILESDLSFFHTKNQSLLDELILSDARQAKLQDLINFMKIASKKIAYPKKSKKQILLRKRLAFFVSTTSFSTSLSENIDFHGYASGLDPRHTLPCRKRLTRDIIELAKKGRLLIKKRILSAHSKPMATADIWSKKGLSSSYLGITLHYISAEDVIEKVVLDLIYFPPPHPGHEIGALVKKVFQEWDIKVPIIVTDNGSNMVKAFKQVRANHVKDVIESVVANTISTEINAEADAVHEDNLFSDSSDIEVDGEVDVSFNEDADIERPAQEEIPTYSISQFDTNQLDDIRKLRNSSANDEGRALAARLQAKMCHGGFNTAVSHLLISGQA
ncbi:Uncharacterized protein APZ42_025507 [Daphnia magna]|uniref:Uncharacterized protein n=1 Tax=Daphnia magna TaxID=35525 RepID=A0A164T0E7_9CRUS|nr:Uncharacterized protein APZ42_025507 [Daphnia magna]